MAKRLTPTKETLNLLFALSGNRCAFPNCTHRLINDKNKFVAQVCHIAAASDGGERANVNMTPEERRLPENLLILCYEHHIETDDVNEFTVEKLREMKAAHEDISRGVINTSDFPLSVIDDMFKSEQKRMQEEVTRTLSNTEQLLINDEKQAATNEEIKNTLSLLVSSMNIQSNDSASDFSAEIDRIMDLRAEKKQEIALHTLEQFKTTNWEKLNPHERYRTEANIGILYLEINEQDKAADFFVAALSFENDSVKSLAIGALGYILKNNRAEADSCIKKSWDIEPLDTGTWYAYVMVNKESIPFSELIAKIPEEVKKDVEVSFGLVQAASAQKLHSEAIFWAQQSLDNATINRYENKAMLATCILQSLMSPYEVLSEQVTEAIKPQIRYIIELYTEAWDEIKDTKLAKSRAWWLINRGVARKFFPDPENTYEDMLESSQHDDNYETLTQVA